MLFSSNNSRSFIPTRAWFATAVLMLLMGLFGVIRSIYDFTENRAHGKHNRIILRSEEPYGFWFYHVANLGSGVMCIAFAVYCAKGGYKSIRLRNTHSEDK